MPEPEPGEIIHLCFSCLAEYHRLGRVTYGSQGVYPHCYLDDQRILSTVGAPGKCQGCGGKTSSQFVVAAAEKSPRERALDEFRRYVAAQEEGNQ